MVFAVTQMLLFSVKFFNCVIAEYANPASDLAIAFSESEW